MANRNQAWTYALVGAVLGAVIGAGATWAITGQRASQLNASLGKLSDAQVAADTRADAMQTKLDDAEKRIADLTTQLDAAKAQSSAETTVQTQPTTGAQRQFAFVRSVSTGANPKLTADYAQMLTGKAAAAAAKAHGDESPPPNDYYIVNDNKKLRTVSVKPGISVTLSSRTDGTTEPDGYTVSYAKWAANYASPTTDNLPIRDAPYWLTIEGGSVVAITEQYLP